MVVNGFLLGQKVNMLPQRYHNTGGGVLHDDDDDSYSDDNVINDCNIKVSQYMCAFNMLITDYTLFIGHCHCPF